MLYQSRGDAHASPRFDHERASAEGRDIFECGVRADGSPHVELQRVDVPEDREPVFGDDDAAWRHVAAKAQAGSALHLEALGRIDLLEHMFIEDKLGCRLPRPPVARR